ncbi:thioesterase family protein [Geodermatophilus sabuli]|uniref:Predicted thioesterase n=1 Tax=Geodermatophilus sabuli TaxID=1564158 RepID=A0A285EBB7_9ACTN|nr:thioesterase family protein [Geodermatophilus sabuli]MBB3084397.1 putative thioesterase [Geodermatophilus sabuli]SNX96335.1 Predicted thioesterase [Geodermatophilus sabuli]
MNPVPVGATALLDVVVTPEMTVRFDELGPVHPVYATYTMAKHFEEAGRKLLLRHLEPGEAGIGRSVSVEHLGPSWVGDTLRVTARCVEVRGNRLTCACTAVDADGRELGRGTTVQAVLSEQDLEARIGAPARDRTGAHRTRPGRAGSRA